MTNLAIALLLALQSSLTNVGQDRLRVISEDMVSVVDREFSLQKMKSTLSQDQALPILAAVATVESGLRYDIERCKTTGDSGRSVGLGQVMRGPNWLGFTKKEICESRYLQLKLALHVIDECWYRVPRADAALRCYTSGNPNKNSYVARKEYETYLAIKRKIHRSVASQTLQACHTGNLSYFYVRERTSTQL